jgi:anti-sigma factor RsiW
MTARIDEELLVAYVDGELDAEAARQVEAALVNDADARRCVRELRESASLLQGAFHGKPETPIPSRLLATIDRAVANGRRRSSWRVPTALAASVAILAVGLSSGYVLSEFRVREALERVEANRRDDRRAIEAAVAEALEKRLSGASIEVSNPGSGLRGAVTPTRTFRDAAGEWCREYEEVIRSGGEVEHRRGIACRTGNGEWKTRLQIGGES